MSGTYVACKKINIIPLGEVEEKKEAYKYLKDCMYAYYKAKNLLMGQIAASFYAHGMDLKNEEFKNDVKRIRKGDNPTLNDIEFPVGSHLKNIAGYDVNKEFIAAVKNGLARGERTITNYKRNGAFPVEKSRIHFDFDFVGNNIDNINELIKSMQVTFCWVNKKKFRLNFGYSKGSFELRKTFFRIYTGEYGYKGSKISERNNKFFLHLTVEIPCKTRELDENTVVGVDLGIVHPAVCALNNNDYEKEYIGSADDFLRRRTKIQAQRRRTQMSLEFCRGQKGRKKKLRALEIYKSNERNFANTFNHQTSNKIIKFALEHNAKYINLENLTGFTDSTEKNFVLRNWSYYELIQMIQYKASACGIEVRTVNPYNTSRICSFCGSEADDKLVNRNSFICKNPDCVSHTFKQKYVESDFNAARNIAKSTEWSTGLKSFSENKEHHEKVAEEVSLKVDTPHG